MVDAFSPTSGNVAMPQPDGYDVAVPPTVAPDGKPLSQYVRLLPDDYQGPPSGSGSPWQALLSGGLATMAAAGKPGATTLGAIGEGGLSAIKSGREQQELEAKTGLQKQQGQYYGAETAQKRVALGVQLEQMNMLRATQGLRPLTMRELVGAGGGAPMASQSMGQPGAQPAPMPSVGGAQVDPSAAPGAPGSSFTADPNQPGAELRPAQSPPQQQAPQQAPQQQPGVFGIPLPVWQGQVAPTKAQAAQMANIYDRAGAKDQATKYREYAMKAPEGFSLTPGYGLQADHNGPADPRYKGSVAAAEGWGKAGPELYVKSNSPTDLRAGGVRYEPMTGNYVQVEERVAGVDPKTGAPFLQPSPMGVVSGNVRTGPVPRIGATDPNALPPTSGGFNVGGGTGRPVAEAPAEGGPGGEARIQTALPPGQHEIIAGAAKNFNEEGRKAYASATDLKGSIEFIKRDLDTMGPQGFLAAGTGADARAAFAKMINSAQAVAGFTPTFDPNKVGAWEDFTKESTLGGMKGLAAIFGGSREAASIIHSSIGAFPKPTSSYQGAQLLVNAFDEAANREIDKRHYETNVALDQKRGGNLTGVNEEFNQKYPPAMYARRAISQVQPYEVSNPEQMKRYLPGTIIKMPDGGLKTVPGETGVKLITGASGG